MTPEDKVDLPFDEPLIEKKDPPVPWPDPPEESVKYSDPGDDEGEQDEPDRSEGSTESLT